MHGKTVVITGATSGIGEVAALRLAEQGARIVFIARDPTRADATLTKLNAAAPALAHKAHLADLSRLKEMKRVGADIAAQEPKIDVLINNAGGVFSQRTPTEDGLEITFATNHMAYFVITQALLANIKQTPGARIVSTSSSAHGRARFDIEEVRAQRIPRASGYGHSKLCNILFTRELARRLEGSGVIANCLHPGFVASRFGDGLGFVSVIIGLAKTMIAVTPEAGADTIIWLAASDEAGRETGGYFYKRQRIEPNAAAQSDANAQELWAFSEELAARV